jgi:sugar phosphate isomerase/epimerase
MSDGPRRPALADYKDDCLRNRVPPGDGEFGAVDFVRMLIDLGVDVPWSLEVCNDDVWGRPGADHVRAAADGMRRVLEQARADTTTSTTTTTTTTIDEEMP